MNKTIFVINDLNNIEKWKSNKITLVIGRHKLLPKQITDCENNIIIQYNDVFTFEHINILKQYLNPSSEIIAILPPDLLDLLVKSLPNSVFTFKMKHLVRKSFPITDYTKNINELKKKYDYNPNEYSIYQYQDNNQYHVSIIKYIGKEPIYPQIKINIHTLNELIKILKKYQFNETDKIIIKKFLEEIGYDK